MNYSRIQLEQQSLPYALLESTRNTQFYHMRPHISRWFDWPCCPSVADSYENILIFTPLLNAALCKAEAGDPYCTFFCIHSSFIYSSIHLLRLSIYFPIMVQAARETPAQSIRAIEPTHLLFSYLHSWRTCLLFITVNGHSNSNPPARNATITYHIILANK